ncbi:Hydrogenobyrinate a,c-diamide synthase [Austwickia sp. TVS 96-490-7B]|uniref:cobyrinate a,c-diamide synthase n=1 Tax=Austwickia sp. TVS 96-490-7B TaxID=2830843 RepID=UPI001C57459A|nr:cobyrinate a,c-diamide synthase [Austwickia sp. TVS 96-490-7B]MBW3084943.1 Hydrogenobyrinate a,c-diamide synthase [Austwickia sp. TVS 96-490-7B]
MKVTAVPPVPAAPEGSAVPDSPADSTGWTLPRCVIAAPASGHGKTTVTIGLLAALRRRGMSVAPAKVGPDYIDPGYHTLAAGRVGRNLDPFLVGEDRIAPLLLHGALTPDPCDVALIEGVMGLYDGKLGTQGFASTAQVAALTGSPIVLVVDVRHTSRTIGAMVHGLATYEPGIRLGGVILNQVGSPRHEAEVRESLAPTGIPVLGALPRDATIEAPSRHLGLVPVEERPESQAALDALADHVADRIDLDALLALASTAPPLTCDPWDPKTAIAATSVALPPPGSPRPVVAVAGGRAFTFRYAETVELLHAAGCEPVIFDPTRDDTLPPGTAGIYLGGGFPQVHAGELAANDALRSAVADAVHAGMPTVAECAGLLYLSRSVDEAPMSGALDLTATMTPRLTLGYREGVAVATSVVASEGQRVTGHEFHRTTVTPTHPNQPAPPPGWMLDGRADGISANPATTGQATVHASYLHVHWAGHPHCAARFAAAVHNYATHTHTENLIDLTHHGDQDIATGLIDLAVNVRPAHTPPWVVRAVTDDLDWAAYPDAEPLRHAAAAHHDVPVESVLPTAGAAEAFTLIARALSPRHPTVIHPQFTEPEAALTAAGHRVRRWTLSATDGFVLPDTDLPDDVDLVIIGNPTNPTSVLHPRTALDRWRRPGRTVVVDEAFMDVVPGETETMIRPDHLDGVLVLRSLTKTWGIAGLRAGYVVGDPTLIAALAAHQPPWSVSTPAIRAGVAVLSEDAAAALAVEQALVAAQRADLVERLRAVGLTVVADPAASFVLVDTSAWGPGSVRVELARRGFAVRRGETFPGLGPQWIRVAVRDEATHVAFADALSALRDRDVMRDTGEPKRPR